MTLVRLAGQLVEILMLLGMPIGLSREQLLLGRCPWMSSTTHVMMAPFWTFTTCTRSICWAIFWKTTQYFCLGLRIETKLNSHCSHGGRGLHNTTLHMPLFLWENLWTDYFLLPCMVMKEGENAGHKQQSLALKAWLVSRATHQTVMTVILLVCGMHLMEKMGINIPLFTACVTTWRDILSFNISHYFFFLGPWRTTTSDWPANSSPS